MPVVAMQPQRQLPGSLARVTIGVRIGPLTQASLDEALGFSICLGCVGLGSDVPEAEAFAGPAERERFVAGSVVGHHALDLGAQALV